MKQDWRETFRSKFGSVRLVELYTNKEIEEVLGDLEQFISELLEEQKKELIAMLPEKRRKVDYPRGRPLDDWHYGWDDGFNQCLEDITNKLK